MNKKLKIKNFGVYYKTAERELVSSTPIQDRGDLMNAYSTFDK